MNCSVTNDPLQLKITNMNCLTISAGQASGSWGVSRVLSQAETSVISRLGWGKICFHTCSHDFWQSLVSYRLLTRDLCSSSTWVAWWIFTTWLMDSPGASDPRESGKGEWEGPRQMAWCLLGFISHLCVNNISRSHAFFIKYHVFQERRDFNLFPWENYRHSF